MHRFHVDGFKYCPKTWLFLLVLFCGGKTKEKLEKAILEDSALQTTRGLGTISIVHSKETTAPAQGLEVREPNTPVSV